MTRRIDVAILGAGQAGLAMSRRLTVAGVDHIVLERGRIGERWRTERWPSLKLLTPNWMTRLPDLAADIEDPEGFMPSAEFTNLLERYADQCAAPVLAECDVYAVGWRGGDFEVVTSSGTWRARSVVVATGACDRPSVPAWARALSPQIRQVTPDHYVVPSHLPQGGALVVGSSATGVQLAREIHASGRPVILASGRHVRTPRSYRGRDVFEWLDRSGFMNEPRGDLDPARLRSQPSFQLLGDREDGSLTLDRLSADGVQIVGRALDGAGCTIAFADDLVAQRAAAEARRRKVLRRIDAYIADLDLPAPEDPAAWIEPLALPTAPNSVDLLASGIRSVIWATGYRRAYPWLHIPVLDASGEIQNDGGITPIPGLFVLGMPFMRHRASALIDGVGRDAAVLVDAITTHLNAQLATAA